MDLEPYLALLFSPRAINSKSAIALYWSLWTVIGYLFSAAVWTLLYNEFVPHGTVSLNPLNTTFTPESMRWRTQLADYLSHWHAVFKPDTTDYFHVALEGLLRTNQFMPEALFDGFGLYVHACVCAQVRVRACQ